MADSETIMAFVGRAKVTWGENAKGKFTELHDSLNQSSSRIPGHVPELMAVAVVVGFRSWAEKAS